MIRIAIQSDLEIRRASYALLLQEFRNFEVVVTVENNEQLTSQLTENAVDVVFYCCEPSNKIDWDVLNQLSIRYPNLMVLLLTNSYNAAMFQKVLDSDFMGYAKDNMSVTELKKAIYQLRTKGYYYDQKMYDDHKKYTRNCKINAATPDGQPIKLTKMERFLLPSFFKGLTTKQIGIKYIKNEETIKTHSRNILQKTYSNSMAEACYKLLLNGVVTLEQLMIQLLLIFFLLGNGLDYSEERFTNDLDTTSSYEWIKRG